jgi:hypothetical protein
VVKLFLIDGLGPEPSHWEFMKLDLRRAFPNVDQYTTSHENIAKQSWAWSENYEAVIIGHSLGAYEAARASMFIKPRLLIGIDPVRPWWLGSPLKHAALHALSLRRSKWFGPRGCDFAIAQRITVPDSDHNNIIKKATPQIIEFIRRSD